MAHLSCKNGRQPANLAQGDQQPLQWLISAHKGIGPTGQRLQTRFCAFAVGDHLHGESEPM